MTIHNFNDVTGIAFYLIKRNVANSVWASCDSHLEAILKLLGL
ncbi:hypothetical protein [Aureibaculum flavum]|nr:hypothetical protein [Aureibaculum flavum]